jgi:hypothetical protein
MVDLDVATRNLKNATLTIGDNGSNTLVVPIEEGNLSWTESDGAAVVMNRGVISHRAVTSEVPLTWGFTAKYVAIKGRTTSGADPTVYEAMHGTGNASDWVSTEDCGAYAFDMLWTLASPCLASASDEQEVVTFPSCHTGQYQVDEGEEFNTIAFSGDALATKPTSVRS